MRNDLIIIMFASDGDGHAMGGQMGPLFAANRMAMFLLFVENKVVEHVVSFEL